MMFKLLVSISTNTFTIVLIGLPLASILQILLCKSLILFNFLHSTSTSSTTHKSMFSKTLKLAKKSDTQPKQGAEEMLPHILFKTQF